MSVLYASTMVNDVTTFMLYLPILLKQEYISLKYDKRQCVFYVIGIVLDSLPPLTATSDLLTMYLSPYTYPNRPNCLAKYNTGRLRLGKNAGLISTRSTANIKS